MSTIEWRTIEEFPKYEINRHGIIRNKKTQRVRVPSFNGSIYLSFKDDDNRTQNRSVRALMKRAFPDGDWTFPSGR